MKCSYSTDLPYLLAHFAMVFFALNAIAAPPQSAPPTSQAEENKSTSTDQDQDKCTEAELRRGQQMHRELAESTGGWVYSGPKEFLGEAMRITFDTSAPNVYNLVWRLGFVDSKRVESIPVTVDTTLSRVDFILSSRKRNTISLAVHRPDGSRVTSDDPKVSLIDIPTLTRVRVESPEAGTWSMKVKGSGGFDASAMGVTKIALVDFTFSLLFTDAPMPFDQELGHNLLLGEEVFFEASLYGEFHDAAAELIYLDGRRLDTLTFMKDQEFGLFGQHTPNQPIDPFLVRVTGTDARGVPFERILRRRYSVSTLVVRPYPKSPVVEARRQVHKIEIHNAGAQDRFKIVARSFDKLPVELSADTVELSQGGFELVDVTVTIPNDPKQKSGTVVVTATSSRDATLKASTILDVPLRRE